MDIVEIIWLDAQSSIEKITLDIAKKKFKPKSTRSVGYMAYETKDYVLLAFMVFGDGVFAQWQIIPRGTIKEIKKIQNGKD
jgi:hypothetical protein